MFLNSNNFKSNMVTNYEQWVVAFIILTISWFLLVKLTAIITTFFHQHALNIKLSYFRTKIIVVQTSLWLWAQVCLYLLPLETVAVDIKNVDINQLSLLSVVSLLHLIFIVSFIVTNPNNNVKIWRFTLLTIMMLLMFIQVNMALIDNGNFNNVGSFFQFALGYYFLFALLLKMFRSNLLLIANLFINSARILLAKPTVETLLTAQLPQGLNSKSQTLILLWQFTAKPYYDDAIITVNDYHEQQLIVTTNINHFRYWLMAYVVRTITKPLQTLKTLINGWQSRELN